MSQVKRLFESHIKYLRGQAQKNGLRFIDLLSASINSPRNAIAERIQSPDAFETKLIAIYRLEFYEWAANQAIQDAENALPSLKARKRGEVESRVVRKALADKNKTDILAKATLLLRTKEKREISGIIMKQTGFSRATVLSALKSHPSGKWN